MLLDWLCTRALFAWRPPGLDSNLASLVDAICRIRGLSLSISPFTYILLGTATYVDSGNRTSKTLRASPAWTWFTLRLDVTPMAEGKLHLLPNVSPFTLAAPSNDVCLQ